MEQGEADSNSTSAWCGGRAAGHSSSWVVSWRLVWWEAWLRRQTRNGGWWKVGHGRQGEWWQVARWGLTSTRSTGGGRRADRPPSRVVPECVAWSCPGVVAPMLHGGHEGRRQRRDIRRRGREIRVSWPVVRSVEFCQTCSRLTIVTSRPPWRRLQHAPSPVWGPKAGGRHTARTRYDQRPLPTGRTPPTPRFDRVSAGVAHPTTTLHHPRGGHSPSGVVATRRPRSANATDS